MPRKTTPTYVLLNQITLAASSASVTFSSIPQNYGDLVLTVNGTANTNQSCAIYLNEDTTAANYFRAEAGGDGSSIFFGNVSTPNWMTMTTSPCTNILQLMDYSSSSKHTSGVARSSYASATLINGIRWGNTAPVATIRVQANSGTFSADTVFSLYGIYA